MESFEKIVVYFSSLFYSIGIFVETESTIKDRQSSGQPSWNERGCLKNILWYLHRISVFYKPSCCIVRRYWSFMHRAQAWMARSDFAPFILGKESSRCYDRQSKDHPSFSLVDLVLRDYKNFFISLVALCSLGTRPSFLRSFAPLEVHRFKFFRGLFLFSFCIFAFFSSSHNVKTLFHVISFVYYFSHLSFL